MFDLLLLSGMPAETCTAICCMTMGGVFKQFPKLKVCFAHGGKYLHLYRNIHVCVPLNYFYKRLPISHISN